MMSKRVLTACLLLPQLVLAGVLVYGLIHSVLQSLGWIPALRLTEFTLHYYIETFSDPNFLGSILFSLKMSVISAALAVIIALLICYWLLEHMAYDQRAMRWFQIPIVIPHLIVALFVLLLFTNTGLIARFWLAIGSQSLAGSMVNWVYQDNAIGIILAYLWKEIPFVVFFCYPLLKDATLRYQPVALTLGATQWQTFWRVTLPNALPTILSSFFIIFAYAMGAYELPKLLGPTLPKSLPELAYVAYTHPDLRHRPYAMVINVIMALIGIVCVGGYLLSMQKEEAHS
ncbi:MAG: ABC transporter permease subunit [Aerococcus sp.]|nr:ABC transporter permease subunit [Aerococcus sp.]